MEDKGKRDISFEKVYGKKELIKIAKQLRYDKKYIEALKKATSENELTRIMAEARRHRNDEKWWKGEEDDVRTES